MMVSRIGHQMAIFISCLTVVVNQEIDKSGDSNFKAFKGGILLKHSINYR